MVRYVLPRLSYDYGDLEPFLDEQTVRVHHLRYHQSYVEGLNAALERVDAGSHPQYISSILCDMDRIPESGRDDIAFFGGGFDNHKMMWESIAPALPPGVHGVPTRRPDGPLGDAMDLYFGGFCNFQDEFVQAAYSVEGSGWCWLVLDASYARLAVMTTENNDTPWMFRRVPLLGLDLWEHAYYMRYGNDCARYIEAWWDAVNWQNVGDRFSGAMQ